MVIEIFLQKKKNNNNNNNNYTTKVKLYTTGEYGY